MKKNKNSKKMKAQPKQPDPAPSTAREAVEKAFVKDEARPQPPNANNDPSSFAKAVAEALKIAGAPENSKVEFIGFEPEEPVTRRVACAQKIDEIEARRHELTVQRRVMIDHHHNRLSNIDKDLERLATDSSLVRQELNTL